MEWSAASHPHLLEPTGSGFKNCGLKVAVFTHLRFVEFKPGILLNLKSSLVGKLAIQIPEHARKMSPSYVHIWLTFQIAFLIWMFVNKNFYPFFLGAKSAAK